ncbi:hypothetical protein STAQ_06970 [Allostella sp. ATCC 35155]|nr:hypothetical protein STAQ_06970 [Stella sp. ATCC 35155]
MDFNHRMLVLAREARGLTQADLADLSQIAQGTLSKYETGVLSLAADSARALSASLRFPLSFFSRPDQVYGFPPFHFRKRKKLSAKALGKIVAEMNIRRIHIQRLGLSFPLKSNQFIPEIDRDEYHGGKKGRLDIEDVARNLRELWMLPAGPVENMVQLLESNGAIVVPCDFGTDLLDAMSQRIDGMPILFFININAPADRIRHTLAHELGHMVLHTTTLKDDVEMEDEADAFAGAFMAPADAVRPQFRKFDLRQLANMKGYWKVSMASLAVRADRLGAITPYQKKQFWMEMSRLGYRKREPNEPPREHPRLLKRMVEYHRKQLGYSIDQLSQLLDLLPQELEAMYGPQAWETEADRRPPHLRLVQ